MPQAPMLPPGMMQQAAGGTSPGSASPLNFLIAAADMQKNGQLPQMGPGAATPQRSMPKGQSMNLPTTAKRERKNIRVIK